MITNEILGGDFDDQLDDIVDAVHDRKRSIAHQKFLDLRIDDRVKLVGKFKPRYLNGATGTVVDKKISNVEIRFDEDIDDPYGKWAGKLCLLPTTMVEKIEEELAAA